jgi:hypothetical protein
MGGDRTLNEALNQAVNLEESKAAARPPVYLPVRKLVEAPVPPTDSHSSGRPVSWLCGSTGHLRRDCPRGPPTTNYNWRTGHAAGRTTDATRQVPEAARTTPGVTFLPDEKRQLEARVAALERQRRRNWQPRRKLRSPILCHPGMRTTGRTSSNK